MANLNKWITNTNVNGTTSKFNGKAVLWSSDLKTELSLTAKRMSGFDLTSFLGFTQIQDILHSIIYYPINLTKQFGYSPAVSKAEIGVGADPVGNPALGYMQGYPFRDSLFEAGFHVGEYKFKSAESFKDLEPYCTTDVWLPYCGKINLPRARIVGKYVNVFLFIDFNTGNAQYVVGTTVKSVSENDTPYYPCISDWNFRLDEIIATEDFILGYKLPIGTLGFNDYLRNTAIGVVKTAASIYGASMFTPSSLIPTETTTVQKVRNNNTGRLVTSSKTTEIKSPANVSDVKNYKKSRIAMATSASINSLALNQMRASVSNTNNPLIMYNTSEDVIFVTTRSKIIPYTEEFDEVYGRPLGESRVLDTVHGFVDLSSIRLDGVGGGKTILEEEVDMLESIMLSGVILP